MYQRLIHDHEALIRIFSLAHWFTLTHARNETIKHELITNSVLNRPDFP